MAQDFVKLGWSRHDILEILERNIAVISVHEHVGIERLHHPNGREIVYKQTLTQMLHRFFDLEIVRLLPESTACAAVVFPMPIYEVFRGRNIEAENGEPDDLYYGRNRALFAACTEFQTTLNSEVKQCFPLPMLAVDPTGDANRFERCYGDILHHVYGLKWHPFAQGRTIESYVEQGFLELASLRGLPTIIHCARPGMPGDLRHLLKLGSIASKLKSVISVAHAGFLHPCLNDSIEIGKLFYIDICPWNMICDFAMPDANFDMRVEALRTLILQLKEAVLFGFDTPWTTIVFPDGTCFGSTPVRDLKSYIAATEPLNPLVKKHLFHHNPLRFLKGLVPQYQMK